MADAPAVAARGPRGVGPRVGDFQQMFSQRQSTRELQVQSARGDTVISADNDSKTAVQIPKKWQTMTGNGSVE